MLLASSSPRRAEILTMLGLDFEVLSTPVPEERAVEEGPAEYVERLAREKALATHEHEPESWVLGGDTVVVLGDEILEKPVDAEDAVGMLRRLAGQTHAVLTALALVSPTGEVFSRVDRTEVAFRDFGEEMARAYVETGEPLDKAGAYGIQGKGAALVESVNGDFFTVMGMSVAGLMALFAAAGYEFRFGAEAGRSPFARL